MNLIDITSFLTTYWYVVVIILAYVILVAFLDGRGALKKYNITAHYLFGFPILMIRTGRGQGFLDRLAVHRSFWRTFANIGLPAMLMGMLAMFILVLLIDISMIYAFQTNTVPAPSKFSEPRNIFLIPGINEYIPLWYGIIALMVTLAVHEFSHAVLCKVEGIRVKSMGILLAVVPIGGFAEPDEEQLLGKKEEKAEAALEEEPKKLATRSERVRILTAGVMANFVTALIAFALFFSLLSYISPVGEVMVTNVLAGSPAEMAGIKTGMILTGINNTQINGGNDFLLYSRTLHPGSNVTLDIIDSGVRKKVGLVAAAGNETRIPVKVASVIEGSPAEAAGIKADMILTRIDGTEIKGIEDFVVFMNSTRPGQKLDIYFMSNSSPLAVPEEFNVELAIHPEFGEQKGFLGISYSPSDGAISYPLGIGIGQFPAKRYLQMLSSIPSLLTERTGWILLFSLPIFGLTGEGFPGFSGLITNFYEPTGMAFYLGAGTFVILNILMWIGWMNFYVGLFNCLPAVPLDGGHVFRDVMTSSLSKVIGGGEKVENISNAIVAIFAILILFSFLFVMFAPYAAHGV